MSIVTEKRRRPKRKPRPAARAPESRPVRADARTVSRPKHAYRTLTLSLVSCALLWAAMPPLHISWLGWVAPWGWLALIRNPTLHGRRPYLTIWATGLVYWVVLLHGIRLAHLANYFGLAALGGYLAVYLPLFVGLSRVAVHRFRIPLTVTAPLVWTALELARGHIITGFSMGLLAHSQVELPRLIQISDLLGAYGVSFAVMFVASCLYQFVDLPQRRLRWQPAVAASGLIIALLSYGTYRLREADALSPTGPEAKVALVQGSVDTQFGVGLDYHRQGYERYRHLMLEIRRKHADLDLIVWPESQFEGDLPEPVFEGPPQLPGLPAEEGKQRAKQILAAFQAKVENAAFDATRRWHGDVVKTEPTHLLVGTTSYRFREGAEKVQNSALLITPQGKIGGRYSKVHPVMFGEYIPFGDWFPAVYDLTPMGQGLTPGDGPHVFEIGGLQISPNICFESTVPHLLRKHMNQLRERKTPADLMVNLTNDGWFRGSTMLDLHFNCTVFRAIEHRMPVLIAANTGFSAEIDSSGRVLQKGRRHKEDAIVATVRADNRTTWYQAIGDLPWTVCLVGCALLAMVGGRDQWARRAPPAAEVGSKNS